VARDCEKQRSLAPSGAANHAWQACNEQIAHILSIHLLACQDESSEPGRLVSHAFQWIAANVLILRDKDPLASCNLGDPLHIRRIATEMIQMHLDVRAGRAQRLCYLKATDLVVEKES